MLEKLAKKLSLQITKLTIWYNAWKEAREIVKAYNQDEPFKNKYNRFIQKHLKTIRLGVVGFTILGLVSTGTVFTLNYLKKTEPQRKAASLAKKENARKIREALQAKKAEEIRILDSIKKIEAVKKNDSVQNALAIKKYDDSLQREDEIKLKNKQRLLEQAIADSIRNAQLKRGVLDSPDSKSPDSFRSNVSAANQRIAASQKKESILNKIKMFFTAKSVKADRKESVQIPDGIETISKSSNDVAINYPNASVVNDTPAIKRVVPAQLHKSAFRADYSILVANKAQKTLYLVKQNSGMVWSIEKEYPIAIGAGLSGPKLAAGDKRTPEGIYFILLRKNKSELNEIYGPLAYVLNYPNDDDRREGRTGQGIWIHGTKGDGDPVPTKGCLSLKNVMMLDIQNNIADGRGTPVVIVNDSVNGDPLAHIDFNMINNKRIEIFTNQEKLLADVNAFLGNWVTAWESRDIDQYSKFYSETNFNSQGMKWNAWKEKKIQTFNAYSSINVDIDNVKLTDWSEHSIEIKFLQNYKSDQKYFENGKKLLLEKDSLSWKITREITIPKEEILL